MSVLTTLENFEAKSPYFLDANNIKDVCELINSQEKPIKIYKNADFNAVLVIDKTEKNRIKFLMNVMTAEDRKKINAHLEEFVSAVEEFETGRWLFDLENAHFIYDYNTKEIADKTKWDFYSKKEFGNHLAMDGDFTRPIKLYNSTNKTSLYWGIYLVNRHFSNPQGHLADEFGAEVALNFAASVYNLGKFSSFFHHRVAVTDAIQIWEKKEEPILDKKYLKLFNKIYQKSIEAEEEVIDPKKEMEEEASLSLSDDGEIYLSDILTYGVLDEYFPVKIDIVTDPRIISAYIQDEKLILVTSVALDERTKENTLDYMPKIREKVEFKRAAEVTAIVTSDEIMNWKKFIRKIQH
jgi:hypothetical protein